MQVPKWLIAIAAISFLVLIVVVAFLVGRQTTRPSAAGIAIEAAPQASVGGKEPDAGASRLSMAAPGGSGPSLAADTPPVAPVAPVTPETAVTPETRARVDAYFRQMEAIRSGGATNDPQDFATKLLSSAVSGDLSGFDNLVRAASDAEHRAAELTPPSECVEYHRQAVTLLGDSTTMLVALRDGLKRGDTNAVASAGASAQSMKIRAEGLAEAERALRKRFGV